MQRSRFQRAVVRIPLLRNNDAAPHPGVYSEGEFFLLTLFFFCQASPASILTARTPRQPCNEDEERQRRRVLRAIGYGEMIAPRVFVCAAWEAVMLMVCSEIDRDSWVLVEKLAFL